MATTLLVNGMVLCLGQTDRIYDHGYVLIENDRIVEVGDAARAPNDITDERIDCAGKLVMPGLVNAHTHTPMTLFRGLAEGVSLLEMDGWYNRIRVLEMVMTGDMVPASVAVACAEMIRTGTTTFADQYFFMEQILPVAAQSGLRAALAYGVVELGNDSARAREIEKLEAFLEEIGNHPSGRLSGWVGPHAFFVDNTVEAMKLERNLARKFSTGLHIHISTTGEEDAYCQQHFGMSAVAKMAALGMMDQPLMAAHAISVPPEDWPTLANPSFTAVAAASACMKAGVEAAPVVGMRAAGINVAIGTDNVCNNNDYDLFLEMRTLAKLASFREKRPGALKAREVVEMATACGAKALGLGDQIGELSPGRKADLIVLDRGGIGWGPLPTNDPFTALVYSVNGLQVTDTMVDGRWLMRGQKLQTLDYAAAIQQQSADVLWLLELRHAAEVNE